MRNLILFASTTVDGFMAGPDNDLGSTRTRQATPIAPPSSGMSPGFREEVAWNGARPRRIRRAASPSEATCSP
jgi:hypothetical protein